MKALFIILALIFAYQIFNQIGVKKLPWFFAGILFFPPAVILVESPQISFFRLMIYCLLISAVKDSKWLVSFKKFPLKSGLIALLIAFLLIGFFDERLSFFLKFFRAINYFLENFFIVFLTWYYLRRRNDLAYIYNKLFWFFMAFALYGITNYLTRENEYNSMIVDSFGGRNFANDMMAAGLERFRISSFSWHAIYYGFLLDVILLIEVFWITTIRMRKSERNVHLAFILLLLINLVLVNSRTPLFTFLLGVGIYILFASTVQQKTKIIVSSLAIFLFAISSFSSVSKLVDESINTFSSKGSDLEGSSVEMREVQLGASILIFNQSPVVGNGFNYITEGLGYSSDENKRKTGNDLMGFESYTYKLLIEQGIVGIVTNLIFFIGLIYWLIKMYWKVDYYGTKMIVITLAMTFCFLAFIIGTGDLGSFLFFMSVLGLNVKFIGLSKKDMIKRPI